ncbi:MAG: DivIVA domain-containing protein [Clostridiaceae bacterium]|nr:DivIVA domain-containing protein [Clostridiaceae bacterium]
MLTVQEIQAMSFEKAVFGGYDQKSVDDFVEELAGDYGTLQKENAALKSKMKVLIDKIEEYRSVENGMRRALVSAQSIAQETIDKAQAESAQLIAEARQNADEQIESYRVQIESEARKLHTAKEKTAQFLSRITALYDEQTKMLMKMSASDELAIESAPAVAKSVVETVSGETRPIPVAASAAVDAVPAAEEDEDADVKVVQQPTTRFNVMEVTLASSAEPLSEQHPRRDYDFGDLKFGNGYNPSEEK